MALVDLLSRMALVSWHKTVAVSGALGSGKSEWVLNLAQGFRQRGDRPVTIADIDITNPYFCVREIADTLVQDGFRVVTALGEARWGDSPALSAEVKRSLAGDGRVLLDVGGDPRGAMALTQLAPEIRETGYDLILVVNAYRPQTRTPGSGPVGPRRARAGAALALRRSGYAVAGIAPLSAPLSAGAARPTTGLAHPPDRPATVGDEPAPRRADAGQERGRCADAPGCGLP